MSERIVKTSSGLVRGYERDGLAEEMHGVWVAFVKNGDPLYGEWPQYEDHNGAGIVRIYNKEMKIQELDRSEMMQLWENLSFYQG